MRCVWVALLLWATACTEARSPPRGLRVPLPEGWVAIPAGSGMLQVGPKGRVVLTLERRPGALLSLNALRGAVESEGASITQANGSASSTSVRYSKPGAPEAMLTVRALEPGVLLLCASTGQTEPSELDAAQTVCGGVRLEAVAATR